MARRSLRSLLACLILCWALNAFAPLSSAEQVCWRLDDPLQVLDLYLEVTPADWDTIRFDTSFRSERPALFSACGEPKIPVKVRRKRNRAFPDDENPQKVSLKIDFNDIDDDQRWHGHNKLSLENGSGKSEGALLAEGLAWQMMARSGLVVGGASWVRVHVNGRSLGVYTRVEEIDKSFLRRHVGEDEHFLYKLDYDFDPLGGNHRRRLTRIGEPDPYAADLCFRPFDDKCPLPNSVFDRLGEWVDLHQFFLLGAMNSLLANFDGPMDAENNYFWYNSPRPRLYFPWDLDLVLWDDWVDGDPHNDIKNAPYKELLFADPTLRRYFDSILLRLMEDAFTLDTLEHMLDDIRVAVGPAFDADPYRPFPNGFQSEIDRILRWFRRRYEAIRPTLVAVSLAALCINEVEAANTSGARDEAGELSDWVELFNRGNAAVQLEGHFLSDDPAVPQKFALPRLLVPPGGRVMIWCDKDIAQGPFHANFRLDPDGDEVGLYRFDVWRRETVDFVWLGRQRENVSLGRFPDGASCFREFDSPTPNAENPGDCGPALTFWTRGDGNLDRHVDVSDAAHTLGGLFLGQEFTCLDAADVDDDGKVSITDALVVLLHLFLGGRAPDAPFPQCGLDPTLDGLSCRRGAACP